MVVGVVRGCRETRQEVGLEEKGGKEALEGESRSNRNFSGIPTRQ